VTVSASNEYLAKVASLHERWETEVRGPLAAFALSHPSRGVQEMAVELDTHVEWVLVRGASLIREVLEHRNHQEMRKLVWDHYRQAQGLSRTCTPRSLRTRAQRCVPRRRAGSLGARVDKPGGHQVSEGNRRGR
jgi:hypothetical protein